MYEAVTIPFFHEGQLCRLSHIHSHVIIVDQRPLIIEDAQNHLCQPSAGYCQFQEFATNPNVGVDCTHRLIAGSNIQELMTVCPFECRKITSVNDVSIIDLGDYHYAVTNAPITTTITCVNRSTPPSTSVYKLMNETHQPGTYIVALRCGCIITIPNLVTINNPIPCRQNNNNTGLVIPTVYLTIPSRWTKLQPSQLSKAVSIHEELYKGTAYTTLEGLLNNHWMMNDSVVNLTEYKYQDFSAFTSDILNHHERYLTYINLLMLTILFVLVFTLWGRDIANTRAAQAANAMAMAYLPVAHGVSTSTPSTCLDDDKLIHNIKIFFLCLGLIDIIILTMFLFIMFCYMKYRWTQRGYGVSCYRDDTEIYAPLSRNNKRKHHNNPAPHMAYPQSFPMTAMHHPQASRTQQIVEAKHYPPLPTQG